MIAGRPVFPLPISRLKTIALIAASAAASALAGSTPSWAGYRVEWQPVDVEIRTEDGLPVEDVRVEIVGSAKKAKFFLVDCATGDRDGPICWVSEPVLQSTAFTDRTGVAQIPRGERVSRSALWKNDPSFSLTALWVRVPGHKWKDPENERTYGPECMARVSELHAHCGRYSLSPEQMGELSKHGLRCTLPLESEKVRERIAQETERFCLPLP